MAGLLSESGAVAQHDDSKVAWHYGDPLREQKRLISGAVVDRSDRDVVTVTGGERLTWLHSLTTQYLSNLQPGTGTCLLVLSPNGHIESSANVFDDGETTWLDTENGHGQALADFLLKMRFFTQVDIEVVTQDWALLTITGHSDVTPPDVLPVPLPKFASGDIPTRPSSIFFGESLPDGGFIRRTDVLGIASIDRMVPRSKFVDVARDLALPFAGTWAFDALRIPETVPYQGIDIDHRTIPHEVPWLLARAVHLEKGCYRGQETVARVHNLGKPPRRLAQVHLDGSDEHPPAVGTDVSANGRVVGRVGIATRHYEEGMIALALLKRNIADKPEAELLIGGSHAGL